MKSFYFQYFILDDLYYLHQVLIDLVGNTLVRFSPSSTFFLSTRFHLY